MMAADLQRVGAALSAYLGAVQDSALDGDAFRYAIPVVGDQLAQNPALGYIGKLQSLVGTLPSTDDPMVIESQLKANLGSALTAITSPNAKGDDVVTFNLKLHETRTQSVPFQVGLSSLGFIVSGGTQLNADVTYDYTLLVTAVVDHETAYISTTATPDVAITVTATTPALNLSGTFGPLAFTGSDPSGGTHLSATYGVDVSAPGGKFTADQAGSLTASANLNLDAGVLLHLTTSFVGAPTINPKLAADFALNWTFNDQPADPTTPGDFGGANAPTASFKNVQLDVGSFFGGFAAPVLADINRVIRPLVPLVTSLDQPLPGLGQIGVTETLLDLLKTAANLYDLKNGTHTASQIVGFIAQVEDVLSVIRAVNKLTNLDGQLIPLGSFNLANGDLRSAANLSGFAPSDTAQFNPLAQLTAKLGSNASAKTFTSNVTNAASGLTFPILDNPDGFFNLLLGKAPATDFVTYHVAPFNLDKAHLTVLGPIIFAIGPVPGTLTVNLDTTLDFGGLDLGYDGNGLTKYFATKAADPAILADGFYIGNKAGSKLLTFSVTLGPDLQVGIDCLLDAGVEGGVRGTASIEFLKNYGTTSGKIRPSDLQKLANGGVPCIFGLSGGLEIYGDIYFEAGGIPDPFGGCLVDPYIRYPIYFPNIPVPGTNFDTSCPGTDDSAAAQPPPTLAKDLGGGVYQLSLGLHRDQRTVATDQTNDSFTVRSDPSDPTGRTILVSAFGYEESYPNATEIVAQGDDKGTMAVNLSGLGAAVSANLVGGTRNDVLTGGAGPTTFVGGPGDDTLTAGSGLTTFYGDGLTEAATDGNDTLIGGPANNTMLVGGGGNDKISAGTGDTILLGGSGNDILTGGSGSDSLDGGSGLDTLYGGAGTNSLIGGTENDTIFSGQGNDTIAGGAGDDHIYIIDPPSNDPKNPHAPLTMITADGGGQAGDILFVAGYAANDGSRSAPDIATITPGATVSNSGNATIADPKGDRVVTTFTTIPAVTAYNLATLNYVAPNQGNNLTIDVPATSGLPSSSTSPKLTALNRISGDGSPSGGATYAGVTFLAVTNVIVDAATKGILDAPGTTVTINNPGAAALMAANLKNFTVLTGAGDDTLTVNADSYLMPVAGGAFTFNPGSGLYADGTTASNVRGLVSLDRIVASGDVDFRLTDAGTTLVDGSTIPDGTAAATTFSIAGSGSGNGGNRGSIRVVGGLEAARLTGGADTNLMDARGFRGNADLQAGSGITTMYGGLGNNVLRGGSGTDTFFGGDSPYSLAGTGLLNSGRTTTAADPSSLPSDLYPGADGTTNTLIGGTGAGLFHVGAAATTIIGGSASNEYFISNPTTGLLAAPFAIDITGGGTGANILGLSGGAGLDVQEYYLLGATAGSGQIVQVRAGSANRPATAQTITFRGITRLNDDSTAGQLLIRADGTADTLALAPGARLDNGPLGLTVDGAATMPIVVANKGKVVAFGPHGVALTPDPIATIPPIVAEDAVATPSPTPSAPPTPAAATPAPPIAAGPVAVAAAVPVAAPTLTLGQPVVAGPAVVKHGKTVKVAHAAAVHPVPVHRATAHKAATAHHAVARQAASKAHARRIWR